MFVSPGSVAVEFLGLTIYWYGIIIALSFMIGLFVTIFIAKNLYKNDNQQELENNIYDLAFVVLIGAIIGARLYYVLLGFDYYSQHPIEMIQVYKGGMTIHGAIAGGFLAGFLYAKKNNLSVLKYADLYSFGLIIGQACGRWGNFFNSEAFGKPTDLPWKLYIPIEAPIGSSSVIKGISPPKRSSACQ